MKKYVAFLVLVLFLSSCSLLSQKKEETKLPQEINQWALSASASDAYGGEFGGNRDDQSAFAATGEPDVPKCEDSQMAWVISKEDDGMHWLELTYDNEVFVSKVKIRESFNPGAVVKVELMNGSDYFTLWEGKDAIKPCPRDLEIKYSEKENNITMGMTPFKTNKIKITLDTDVPGWNEIDAVQLSGYDSRWYYFNNTLTLI